MSQTNPLGNLPAFRRRSEQEERRRELLEVLTDIRDLLEQYSPTWYRDNYREKLERGLRLLNRL